MSYYYFVFEYFFGKKGFPFKSRNMSNITNITNYPRNTTCSLFNI